MTNAELSKLVGGVVERLNELESRPLPSGGAGVNPSVVFKDEVPFKANPYDAGFDLPCTRGFTIAAGKSVKVGTGIRVAIPKGYVGITYSRSGLNINRGVFVPSGVIDHGYTGEISLRVYNLGDGTFECNKGDRLAQLVVVPCVTEAAITVDLDDSDRGENGFGSSGV